MSDAPGRGPRRDGRICAVFHVPEGRDAMLPPADEPMGDMDFEEYRVDTTWGRGRAIRREVLDAAGESYEMGEPGGVILDAGRFAELAVYLVSCSSARDPVGPAEVVDRAFTFDVHAVRTGGAELCDGLCDNAEKAWEAHDG